MEDPKRLKPTSDALRILFAHSGNQCAFPGCIHPLINSHGEFIGQICHIEGVKGERFNPSMTNEQRRDPSNLVLMCYAHHVETNNEDVWSVSKMREIKRKHEQIFAQPDQLILRKLNDWTTRDTIVFPGNLRRLYNSHELYEEDHPMVLDEVNRYLSRLETVPIDVRRFLGKVVERMDRVKRIVKLEGGSAAIPAEDFRLAFGLTVNQVKRDCENLQTYRLGYLDVEEDGSADIVINGVCDYPFWNDVLLLSKRDGLNFSSFYLDLDFSPLGD